MSVVEPLSFSYIFITIYIFKLLDIRSYLIITYSEILMVCNIKDQMIPFLLLTFAHLILKRTNDSTNIKCLFLDLDLIITNNNISSSIYDK